MTWDNLSKKEQFEIIVDNYNLDDTSVRFPSDFDTRGMIYISGEFSFGQLGEIMEAWARYMEEKEKV